MKTPLVRYFRKNVQSYSQVAKHTHGPLNPFKPVKRKDSGIAK
jgi:hypothetical protein